MGSVARYGGMDPAEEYRILADLIDHLGEQNVILGDINSDNDPGRDGTHTIEVHLPENRSYPFHDT